jgi:ribosomal protein S18 acetylase RimI-like enzyme
VEPLDNWAWGALTGPQQGFAEGAPPAVRYQSDVSVFGALPDEITPDAWDALATLVGPQAMTVLFRAEIGPVPETWSQLGAGLGVQMVGPAPGGPRPTGTRPTGSRVEMVALTAEDVPAMTELVARTEPGPFEVRTVELGTYLGVRDGDRLVSMAGQRMRLDGHTEISAVCTDADHRGRGLAGLLLDHLVDEIHSRGDVPFLHALSTNAVAISRYASLGFEVRRTVQAAAVTPPS